MALRFSLLCLFAGTALAGTKTAVDDTYQAPEVDDQCQDIPRFNSAGPDDQVVKAPPDFRWDYLPGFKEPGSCWNREPVKLANGVLRFALIWVDDSPQFTNPGYRVSLHRTHFEIPLTKRGDHVDANSPGCSDGCGAADDYKYELGAFQIRDVKPLVWSRGGVSSTTTSNQLRIRARFAKQVTSDVTKYSGQGRFGEVLVEVGTDGKFERHSDKHSDAGVVFVVLGTNFRKVDPSDYQDPSLFKKVCTAGNDFFCR